MVYPWTVTDNVNFIIGYLMGQWKIAIEAFFVICTFINNGKGAVSAGYFIDNNNIIPDNAYTTRYPSKRRCFMRGKRW